MGREQHTDDLDHRIVLSTTQEFRIETTTGGLCGNIQNSVTIKREL